MRNWFLFVLWTALLFFLGLGDGHVLQHRANDLISTVFRGDMRSPDVIKAAGGFFPRKAEETLGRALTPVELEQQSSLYFHHVGATSKFTKYVSTTSDPKIAKDFATPFRSAQQGEESLGYIYRISADPKMIDVIESVGRKNMMAQYLSQAEHAVVTGVPHDQIEGWYKAKDIGEAELEKLRNGDKLESLFEKNPAFNPKYLELRGSGAQPQLAGFGKRGKGVQAKKEMPWKQFKDLKVQDQLEEFRLRVAPDLKAPEGAIQAEESAVFVEADALGARDLIGSLDVGEVREGLTSVEITTAAAEAEEIAVTAELEAAEIAEAAEAIEAAELLEAAEALAGLAEVSVLGELLPWLVILA
ncbi:hypothetical protein QQS21_012620 [Conoideocrella luteorostrata]|uniref:Uncharacterized protein n=1 Tax=Conoideocrella luteorostrata TaxID=1105319 RepID=A0AAJ0FUN3_9HYPO|nr:hypothetical protein QQS21_012620 [Conoideocrella luteorostrata]